MLWIILGIGNFYRQNRGVYNVEMYLLCCDVQLHAVLKRYVFRKVHFLAV